MKLVIRELANEDVDDCTDYIQRNSVAAALRFPVNVLETARWLASHPGAGHPVKVHRRSRLRSFAVRGFPTICCSIASRAMNWW
jgi:plasmid stabilization system protein ParE